MTARGRFRSGARRPLVPEPGALAFEWLPGAEEFVRVVRAPAPGTDLVAFVARHAERLRQWVESSGALVLRGFQVPSAAHFGRAVRHLGPVLPYVDRAARRTEVAPGVFTSTELSADQVIPQHHEMSYADRWPRLVFFWCAQPAVRGGETPLSSERAVTAALPADIKTMLRERGILYVRHYREGGLDLSWKEAFQTESPAEAERLARDRGQRAEWIGTVLRTERRGPALVTHPDTGEELWFNHLHLFHRTNLGAEQRAALTAALGSDRLPRDARLGDGQPVADDIVDTIRAVYDAHRIVIGWRQDDVLVVDNYLAAHGRQAFHGDRSVYVAMAELCHLGEQRS